MNDPDNEFDAHDKVNGNYCVSKSCLLPPVFPLHFKRNPFNQFRGEGHTLFDHLAHFNQILHY